MKVYDFSKRELSEMPLITEPAKFEYILDYNLITQIEEIPQTCYKLSLSNNKISFINSKFLKDLQLKYLDLSFNRIISLIGFEKFKLLEELNLSNNYIGDDQVNYLIPLSKLKALNLSNNNLKKAEITKIIYISKSLQKLNLSNNNIEELTFEKSNSLIELELDNNKLNKLSFNGYAKQFEYLMYLSVNENKLQSIENLNILVNLEYLSLSVNELAHINIDKLTKLKYLQLKSNSLDNMAIHKTNQLLQYIDISFNNLNSFSIEGDFPNLKNLILDNNKLSGVDFGGVGGPVPPPTNKFKNLELLDISFNLISNVQFLLLFKNVQKLNLSFNNIDNLIDLLTLLNNFQQLKDLNLIENEFNKNIYNTDVMNNFVYNNIREYLISPNVNNMYKSQLNSYRSCIIINLNHLLCLDNINITKEEKNRAMKMSEYKLSTIDVKASNFSINLGKEKKNNIGNDYIIDSTTERNNENENDIDIDIKNKNQNQNQNFYNYMDNNDDIITNNTNNNNGNYIIEEEDDEDCKLSSIQNQRTGNQNIKSPPYQMRKIKSNQNENNGISNNSDEEDKIKIYKMLSQTLYNLCDNKGYISFQYFLSLAEELVMEYSISPQLNEMAKEVNLLVKSSLLPGKFHIKDILKIMQNKKYDTLYYTISQALKKKPTSLISQSIHLSQWVKKKYLKKEDTKENYDNGDKKFINFNKEYSKSNENKKDYKILNTLKMKTPLLSASNNYKNDAVDKNENNNNEKEYNSLNKGCFNLLFKSFSELSRPPDLKNQLFLKNFLYFINHISFPIHFKEAEQSFVINIYPQEKEYKFMQSFMNNFKMINFELNKWYCHNYYRQIFEDFETYEFLFEHNILIFYSYYNEIIDNFFNDVYQIQDCYLMIEDNPLNLFEPNMNGDTRIVLLVLIQWKDYNDENKQIENIVFNKNDNRYYFKNPFNWIGKDGNKNEIRNNKIMNNYNILVPVYIFSNINFSGEEASSFIKLFGNINNKTF